MKRQWVIKRGDRYLTTNGGWSKDVSKAHVYTDRRKAADGLLKGVEEVVPHWVSGEAW